MVVVLNWLTQGVIVAIAAAVGLRVIPPSQARARYGFLWAAYLLVLALPAMPLIPTGTVDVPAVELASFSGRVAMPAAWWTSPVLAIGLWIAWSGIQAVRLLAASIALREAKRQSRPCPPDVLARLPHWPRVRATGRRTRVVVSTRVRFAAVLGTGSPVIGLAPGLIERLREADLDRVIIHEWAHVQRRDDLARLVQRLVHVIVGWHPAVWWLDRQLEIEREVACDEIAVATTGSAKAYAACLTTVAALPLAPVRSLPVLAAVSDSLRRRLVRILAGQHAAAQQPRRGLAACAGVGLTATALAVGNVHVVAALPPSAIPLTAVRPARARAVGPDAPAASRPVVSQPPAGATSALPPNLLSDRRVRSVTRQQEAPARTDDARVMDEPPTPAIALVPLRPLNGSLEIPGATAQASETFVTRRDDGGDSTALETVAVTLPSEVEKVPAPWTVAADTGVAIGRMSQRAGVATAGFFTRFGKNIARSF